MVEGASGDVFLYVTRSLQKDHHQTVLSLSLCLFPSLISCTYRQYTFIDAAIFRMSDVYHADVSRSDEDNVTTFQANFLESLEGIYAV